MVLIDFIIRLICTVSSTLSPSRGYQTWYAINTTSTIEQVNITTTLLQRYILG